MVKRRLVLSVLACILLAFQSADADIRHRFGGGVHYWRSIKSIGSDDVKESGMAYLVSYQMRPVMLVKLGVDLEMLPKEYAGVGKPVYSPQLYVVVGSILYVGLGVGTYYSDGDFSKDLFYNLRAGLDFPVFPFVSLDINANYRFENWNDIKTVKEDVRSDTVTLGAAVRFSL